MNIASSVPPGDCFTCDVNADRRVPPGGTIYEDDRWIADHGVSLLVRGYVVLKPKRHVHELADLMPEEAPTFGTVMQTILAAMRRALVTARIYVRSFAETVYTCIPTCCRGTPTCWDSVPNSCLPCSRVMNAGHAHRPKPKERRLSCGNSSSSPHRDAMMM